MLPIQSYRRRGGSKILTTAELDNQLHEMVAGNEASLGHAFMVQRLGLNGSNCEDSSKLRVLWVYTNSLGEHRRGFLWRTSLVHNYSTDGGYNTANTTGTSNEIAMSWATIGQRAPNHAACATPIHSPSLITRSSSVPDNPADTGKSIEVRASTKFADILTNDHTKLGRTTLMEHHIPTKVCKTAVRPEKKFTPKEEVVIGKEIQEMLRIDVIAPGKSEWVAPLSISQKKDRMRLCTSYQALNKEILKDNYPLPNVFKTLQALSCNSWFSTLDMMSGFWQVPIAKEYIHKTGFICDAVWHGKHIPNFPEADCDMICLVYIDDIIIMGHSFEEHIQNIWEVLMRLRGANLKVQQMQKGIQMDEGRIKVLTDWKAPTQWKGDLEYWLHGLALGTGLEGWQAMQERDGD
ncbi:Transposon Ty3-G Gag-Pol polyprotein [Pelomyxa schiedti]|nr:Transposon Ty3-G Gag-Pol polyprotein [Pelomyxa schiedti]